MRILCVVRENICCDKVLKPVFYNIINGYNNNHNLLFSISLLTIHIDKT